MSNICIQCGWKKEDHRNGFCYSHSDESEDYFYSDRKFISEDSLKGKDYYTSFNGKIMIKETKPINS